MTFHAQTGWNTGGCRVMLETEEMAKKVIGELQGAVLSDKEVHIMAATDQPPNKRLHSGKPEFNWGWIASPDPQIGHMKLRAPWLMPSVDVRAEQNLGMT